VKVGDLVKDWLRGRIGIITKKGTAQVKERGTVTKYLVVYVPDGRNFRSKEKWMEPQYFEEVINESR